MIAKRHITLSAVLIMAVAGSLLKGKSTRTCLGPGSMYQSFQDAIIDRAILEIQSLTK
jgi:hypothetical protein